MQDRPDLIQSELSGLAFDSLQCVFRPADIEIMYAQDPPDPVLNADIYLFIDPAAGGPQSDYAILSFQRQKGLVTVSAQSHTHYRAALWGPQTFILQHGTAYHSRNCL